jgi:hypothetical protein
MNRRRFGVAAGIVSLLALIAAGKFVFEPFESRYEGKTVRQWVQYVERQQALQLERFFETSKLGRASIAIEMPPPDRKVIDAFGRSAVPALSRVARAGNFMIRARRFVPIRALSDMFKVFQDRAIRRAEVAQRWLQEIFGPTPPSHILTPPTHRTNNAARDEALFVRMLPTVYRDGKG